MKSGSRHRQRLAVVGWQAAPEPLQQPVGPHEPADVRILRAGELLMHVAHADGRTLEPIVGPPAVQRQFELTGTLDRLSSHVPGATPPARPDAGRDDTARRRWRT